MTSRYETFSISLAEALAAGSPVVATNVGAIKELVTSHFNGLLAEPESAASIAENVLTLLDDPQKMQVLSRNAIEDSKARFAPKIVAKQSMEFYRSIIADNI
jgi:glycosyltransferase involved in cell wall biosynthesis